MKVKMKEFKDYKRRVSKRWSELLGRIVRLEQKEAESYCMSQAIPKLYLEIETLKKEVSELKDQIRQQPTQKIQQ